MRTGNLPPLIPLLLTIPPAEGEKAPAQSLPGEERSAANLEKSNAIFGDPSKFIPGEIVEGTGNRNTRSSRT